MVLLTGHTGFLGRYIHKEFDTNNVSFNTIGRSNSDIIYNFDKVIYDLDYYDLVIHAAGVAHLSSNVIEESFKFNTESTLNLLKSLEISGIPKCFVFISSVSVYGRSSGVSITEDSPLNATDYYGKSKIDAERLVIRWCSQFKTKYLILRLPLLFGDNPPGNLGNMINSIRKRYYFNIASGNAKRSVVLASDVAKCIINAANIGGIYNLTDGINPSICQLSIYIARRFGIHYVPSMPLYLAKFLAKIGDKLFFPINSNKLNKLVNSLTFDDSKARRKFNWNPDPVIN